MNKKVKKFLIKAVAVISLLSMTYGCNRQLVDVTYAFKTAVLKNDGNTVFMPIAKWKDYAGEAVQLITNDAMAIYTSSYVADLINNNQNENLALNYAKAMADEDGTVSFYENSNNENESFNYQLLDFQYNFDKAIIIQNDRAVVIPVAKWKDYNGEQIQIITPENVVFIVSTYNTLLVSDNKSIKKAVDLANMLVGEHGVVTDLAGDFRNADFNLQLVDLKLSFNKAIMLGDDSNCILPLETWTDYEDGEQYQINVLNGLTQVCSSFNSILINDVNGKNITAEAISKALNTNLVDYSQGIDFGSKWFNKQILDLNYAFQNVVISNGSSSVVLPVKQWCDYDGEQLQFTYKNDVTMLSSSIDSSMYAPGSGDIKASDVASAISTNTINLDSDYRLDSFYNKTIFDLKYKYPYALIVNDNSILILALDSWRDYEGGEQLQLTLLGKETTLLSTAYDTKLVNLGNSGLSIQEVAGWFNDGSKQVVDLTNGAKGFGKFNYQLVDTHWEFDYAIAINGDVATIIPIEKWIDYDGDYTTDEDGNKTYTDYTEQLQISFDGSSKIYSDNTNIKLVKAEDIEIVEQIARGYLSENGVVKLYESQDLIRKLD